MGMAPVIGQSPACTDHAPTHVEAPRNLLTQARTGAKPYAESISAAMPAP